MSSSNKLRIAIVTPTYRRTSFLARFIRRVLRQDYGMWRLVIVHDGQDAETRGLVEGFASEDRRIYFVNTDKRYKDFGITPRLLGAKIITSWDLADYTVFWDDDNAFFPGALTSIVHSLEYHGMPEVLLVPVRYQNSILPQPVPVEQLRVGQVDMANFVVRSPLAARVYEKVWNRVLRDERSYIQDFWFLDVLRRELGPARIHHAKCQPLGRYDGLRIIETIRWKCRIPYLGLSRFSWFRWLRQSVYKRS